MVLIQKFIGRYVHLAEGELALVLTKFHFRSAPANSLVLQYVQTAHEFCYVEKGAFRMVNPITEPERKERARLRQRQMNTEGR